MRIIFLSKKKEENGGRSGRMKLIVEEKDGCVEAVKIECTTTEYLVLNQAMKKYAGNGEINDIDRDIMRRMLEVEPIFEDVNDVEEIKVGDEVQSYDTRYIVVRVRNNETFDGIGACGTDEGLDLSKYHKTGRHFPQIAEVLKQMQEGSEKERKNE